jgi:hypothetical protein
MQAMKATDETDKIWVFFPKETINVASIGKWVLVVPPTRTPHPAPRAHTPLPFSQQPATIRRTLSGGALMRAGVCVFVDVDSSPWCGRIWVLG